jgi:outer membrane protein assembly factor BamD
MFSRLVTMKGFERSGRLLACLAALVLIGITLGGCTLFDKDVVLPDEPADKLYNEGLYLLNNKKNPKEAAKKFEEVDRQHPYSEWARKALIMSAYAYYESGNFDDCINSARRYVTLHPGSPDAAYAQFLIGSSYFDQIPEISRDQERAEKAVQTLDEVVRKYPNSEYAVAAKRKIEMARDQLAGKEMEIGRYYSRKKAYLAGINRYKTVLTRYQTTSHAPEALYRLTEAYLALGVRSEAQTAAAVLGHNYPNSDWYKDAYQLLANEGLAPQANSDSWISRIF